MNCSTMYESFGKIKLLRYLVAWRVNCSLALLPVCFSVELSRVLGHIIVNRLSTREAGRWQKALSSLEQHCKLSCMEGRKPSGSITFPEAAWPVDTVFLVYPGKRTYGLGELIFWELKLFGDAANHGFFLETILPAMEEAGFTSDARWTGENRIWGRFDIHAVYVARGSCWDPIVREGCLDLRSQPGAGQWAEGMTFGADRARPFKQLSWLTPFDVEGVEERRQPGLAGAVETGTQDSRFPLKAILDGLSSRLIQLTPKTRKATGSAWDILDERGRILHQKALESAMHPRLIFKELDQVPLEWPGRWIGKYVFDSIPKEVIPFLDLGSILHIGKHSHFGCGTFMLV